MEGTYFLLLGHCMLSLPFCMLKKCHVGAFQDEDETEDYAGGDGEGEGEAEDDDAADEDEDEEEAEANGELFIIGNASCTTLKFFYVIFAADLWGVRYIRRDKRNSGV